MLFEPSLYLRIFTLVSWFRSFPFTKLSPPLELTKVGMVNDCIGITFEPGYVGFRINSESGEAKWEI